jgi:hypothetical protein
MLMTGRQCAMLKDVTAPDMPTDFVGQIYTSIDLADPARSRRRHTVGSPRDLGSADVRAAHARQLIRCLTLPV